MIYQTLLRWQQCRESLLPAIELTHGTHTEDDVICQILAGQLQLWVHGSSGVVTEINKFPQMKCLNVFLVGGDLEEVNAMRPEIERFAIKNECSRVTALAARRGWERMLGSDGKMGGTVIYRDL